MRFPALKSSAIVLAFVALPLAANLALAQQDHDATAVPTIKVESRVVLVDTVVTDKSGNYLRDLTMKDFKVWEDNKEQVITSFSFEDDAASPSKSQKQYLVLFFDNSTMDAGDQGRARQAAAQFIDANAGPNRLIALVDFAGAVHISQNFTADTERLKQVVATVKGSAVSPNAAAPPVQIASLATPAGMPGAMQGGVQTFPTLGNSEADFGARSVLLALRSLAKNLAGVPGRKTLVMLTSGFSMNTQLQSELTAAIDACNKANVAIYPIDVRGLAGPALGKLRMPRGTEAVRAQGPHSGHLVFTTLNSGVTPPARLVLVQHGGGPPAAAVEAAEWVVVAAAPAAELVEAVAVEVRPAVGIAAEVAATPGDSRHCERRQHQPAGDVQLPTAELSAARHRSAISSQRYHQSAGAVSTRRWHRRVRHPQHQ